MNPFLRKKDQLKRRLSAYLDGELEALETASVAEDLVFDTEAERQLHSLAQIDALTRAALTPERRPDPAVCAERVLASAAAAGESEREFPLPSPHRHLKPAVLASIGILVTAGITLARLRRRGLV